MKAFVLAPMAALAMLAFGISTASSQPAACGKDYVACMDSCAGRSSKGIQDSCFKSCESQNNMCSERIYGRRPFNGTPSNAAEQSGQAKEALAKEKAPEAPEPQAAAQAPAPERAAPAPQRGPVRR